MAWCECAWLGKFVGKIGRKDDEEEEARSKVIPAEILQKFGNLIGQLRGTPSPPPPNLHKQTPPPHQSPSIHSISSHPRKVLGQGPFLNLNLKSSFFSQIEKIPRNFIDSWFFGINFWILKNYANKSKNIIGFCFCF